MLDVIDVAVRAMREHGPERVAVDVGAIGVLSSIVCMQAAPEPGAIGGSDVDMKEITARIPAAMLVACGERLLSEAHTATADEHGGIEATPSIEALNDLVTMLHALASDTNPVVASWLHSAPFSALRQLVTSVSPLVSALGADGHGGAVKASALLHALNAHEEAGQQPRRGAAASGLSAWKAPTQNARESFEPQNENADEANSSEREREKMQQLADAACASHKEASDAMALMEEFAALNERVRGELRTRLVELDDARTQLAARDAAAGALAERLVASELLCATLRTRCDELERANRRLRRGHGAPSTSPSGGVPNSGTIRQQPAASETPAAASPAIYLSMTTAAEDVVVTLLRQHPVPRPGAGGVASDDELTRKLGVALRRAFLRLARSSDPAVAAIEPMPAVRIRRFVAECGLLRAGSKLCLADVDMALQWRTPHHQDGEGTAAGSDRTGAVLADKLTRRLPELTFADFCYVVLNLAAKAFSRLGVRTALRKLHQLLAAVPSSQQLEREDDNADEVDGEGTQRSRTSAWPEAWHDSTGSVNCDEGMGLIMDEVRAGRAKTGLALLIVSLVRPTQVRPVIDRERQALARIFDAYAQPRDRMARRGMIDLVRDFGIIPSLVPPTTCQRLFLQIAYGLEEKSALELVPAGVDDESASLDLGQFLEWTARLAVECAWLSEQRGYSTPALRAQGLLQWMDMSAGKDKVFHRRGGKPLAPFEATLHPIAHASE